MFLFVVVVAPYAPEFKGVFLSSCPFQHKLCGAMRDRSRSRRPWRGSIHQLQPAARGHPRPQVQWISVVN